MNELNLTTPSLLFSAISLILLAYTNRFLSYASVVRTLNDRYQENPDKDPTTLNQIRNFVLRLRLIRAMQIFGVSSLILCLASMFLFSVKQVLFGEIVFGTGMVALAISLVLCIWEIQISTEAISLHLQNIRRRQREQDPFMGNSLRRNVSRREGESLGEHNNRKNKEKQLREKQEREEANNREAEAKSVEKTKTNQARSSRKERSAKPKNQVGEEVSGQNTSSSTTSKKVQEPKNSKEKSREKQISKANTTVENQEQVSTTPKLAPLSSTHSQLLEIQSTLEQSHLLETQVTSEQSSALDAQPASVQQAPQPQTRERKIFANRKVKEGGKGNQEEVSETVQQPSRYQLRQRERK